ncbi:N-acetylmuramoyl-L-alanine amidase [Bradyrhizobium sp. G127]|uniref:N-acetylmuramoyl-L-alanine amidase n=1 Tax=Bradyrhizobium sp. G127 TaxID=2904800 RepID=UPI001F2AC9DC|nr:N-acetylmuramoyl-L-alanine amidase [Bradyrhizobium sp. G127]MCF2522566.1 N-acetylmuramoyl-L-alanine amidase [Bradyrhizobium sp. G127]
MLSFVPDSSVVSTVTPSPNYGDRKGVLSPDMIVLHYTGMADAASAIVRLCTEGTEVSAHYVVLEDGNIVQCVRESARAWHSGTSSWGGETDINSCSIGIEIVNRGHDLGYTDFPLRQVAAVIALCKGIMIRRDIQKHRVLAHSDVAPGRKKDPGEKFPWRLLADSGVGLWTEPAPIVDGEQKLLGASGDDVLALQRSLSRFGYGVPLSGQYDTATMDVVAAFQRHFRPERVDGVADQSTLTTLHDLLALLPREITLTS